MLRLLLVRHGETDWNAQRRYQGQTDVPLSEIGRQQVERLARRLTGERCDLIYTSDLQRAFETATIIGENLDVDVIPEPRLREMSFGIFEGLTFDDAQRRYPDIVAAWLNDYNQPPPEGERFADLLVRARSLLDDLRESHADQTLLLVAHGGTLSILICFVLGIPPEKHWSFALDNASLSELHLWEEGSPLLKRLNERC